MSFRMSSWASTAAPFHQGGSTLLTGGQGQIARFAERVTPPTPMLPAPAQPDIDTDQALTIRAEAALSAHGYGRK